MTVQLINKIIKVKWSKAIFRQYIATFSSLLCSVMTAICFVWFTPLMVWLLDPSNHEIEGLDNDQLSWLIAFIEIGELLGPIPCGYIADRWGRKPCLLVTFPLVFVSWIITFFTRSLAGLYAARTLQGVAIGILYTIGPVYITEIADPDIRGQLGGHWQSSWFVGVLISYGSGPFVSYQNYIIISAIPALLFLLTFSFMPETPYFYMMAGRRDAAEASLSWFRGDTDVEKELLVIEESINANKNDKAKKGVWKDLLFSKKCRKPLLILTLITLIKYLAGPNTITNFASQTFAKSTGDARNADFITIGFGVILLVTSCLATLVADVAGRKTLMVASTLGVGISCSITAAYYYLERETSVDVSSYSWIAYAGIIAFCLTFNLGLGLLQTTIQAEYFASHVRAAAGAYTTIFSNFLCFISIKQYQLFDDHIGVYSNFLLYACISFAGLLFLIPFMEETAKKSLSEIQNTL